MRMENQSPGETKSRIDSISNGYTYFDSVHMDCEKYLQDIHLIINLQIVSLKYYTHSWWKNKQRNR